MITGFTTMLSFVLIVATLLSTVSALNLTASYEGDPYRINHHSLGDFATPGPSTCFNQGPGQLHAWMKNLATAFCIAIDGMEFQYPLRNNSATAIWQVTDPPYDYNGLKHAYGSHTWQQYPPTSAMLQVGFTPSSCGEYAPQAQDWKMTRSACLEAFNIIVDGCNTADDDGKQGGQLLVWYEGVRQTMPCSQGWIWGFDGMYYTFDTNYRGSPANIYSPTAGREDEQVDIIEDATMWAFQNHISK